MLGSQDGSATYQGERGGDGWAHLLIIWDKLLMNKMYPILLGTPPVIRPVLGNWCCPLVIFA